MSAVKVTGLAWRGHVPGCVIELGLKAGWPDSEVQAMLLHGEDAAREGATAGPGDGCPLPESDGHAPCPDPAMWWLLPPSCTYLVSF